MPQPDPGSPATSTSSRPLVLAWVVVIAALVSALGYAFLVPPPEPLEPLAEFQIPLADVPTISDQAGDAASAAPSPATARQRTQDTPPDEPAASEAKPRIAVVLSGLGLSESATSAAIERLPAAVTLSFTPYGEDLGRWLDAAGEAGHEVMIDLPMEPASFPSNDPGPRALVTSLSQEENLARLDWILARGEGFVGVTGFMGSRFSRSREDMLPILSALKERDLLYLDNRATELSVASSLAAEIGLARAVNNRTIDDGHASQVVIDARLAQIERLALTDGAAVAIAHPFTLTLERLANWSETLAARGFTLVPISKVADNQPQPAE